MKKQKRQLKSFRIKFWIKGLDEKGVPLDWAREAYNKGDLKRRVREECGQRQIIVHSINEL